MIDKEMNKWMMNIKKKNKWIIKIVREMNKWMMETNIKNDKENKRDE